MNGASATRAGVLEAGLRDIRGPVAIPGEWLWLWLLSAGIFLVLLFWLARHFSKRATPQPVVIPKPAWETALLALQVLEKAGLIGQGRAKEYYSSLSGIVRGYIEERFDVRAPEMTTEEFMEAIRHSEKLTTDQRGFLKDFLNASDMVKFARFAPSGDDMRQVMALARTFVEEVR